MCSHKQSFSRLGRLLAASSVARPTTGEKGDTACVEWEWGSGRESPQLAREVLPRGSDLMNNTMLEGHEDGRGEGSDTMQGVGELYERPQPTSAASAGLSTLPSRISLASEAEGIKLLGYSVQRPSA